MGPGGWDLLCIQSEGQLIARRQANGSDLTVA